MTKDEALKLALEALKRATNYDPVIARAITAIKEALAQPEFIKHEVENADDWSEWVCPDPNGYLMKCCDCGLVHEAEFGVVRYKSETEREDCDIVDDPNLQAVFRMRRSEQWLPEDTAHRAGGLPMAQPEQDGKCKYCTDGCPACDARKLPEQEPFMASYEFKEYGYYKDGKGTLKLGNIPATQQSQRTWVGLTDIDYAGLPLEQVGLVRWAEAKLKEKNT